MAFEPQVGHIDYPDARYAEQVYTGVAQNLYIRDANTTDNRGAVLDEPIEFAFLSYTAGLSLPPPNQIANAPVGVKMSALMQHFTESLQVVQDTLLGAP